MNQPILTFEGITKRFPGVNALADVSFEIAAGDCHALCGENGAGKSTLGKIVAGIYRPDAGRMLLDGRPASFRTPLAAARAGVSIVHQELAFCPNLSIAENLFLGQTPSAGFVRWSALYDGARRMLDRVGLNLDPCTPMEQLSTGQEQLAQIAVAIGRGARIIIMDEPTSSLSQAEAQRLFEILDQLRRDGVTVIYVSHRLDEITRLCDRVSVLRDGRYVATHRTAETSPAEIVRLMIGRPLAEYLPAQLNATLGPVLLSVNGLTSAAGHFRDVSFEVRAGEIVGLAGLVGAGRSEVARAIFGVDALAGGQVRLDGRSVQIRSPQDAIRQGIGLLPEDRKRQGLVLSMTCKENLTLSLLKRLRRWLLLNHHEEAELGRRYFERLRVRAPNIESGIAGLSGGNQQKIALAKWLAQHSRVLILDEPTRGVDVGAKAEIHGLIDRLASEGHAILLISSELPELLALSSRVLVLANGRLVGELTREQATQESVMRLMANVTAA